MKKPNKKLTNAALLRQKAEEQLKSQQPNRGLSFSEHDMLKLIYELEVHQIELEMQNEELVIAKEKAELAEEKYTELYDFAPSGYISLSKRGEILELNFAAARILGKERTKLIKKQFDFFVSIDTQLTFNLFLHEVFTSKLKQTCEVIVATEGNLPIYVNIDGIVSLNNELCLLTLIDITERKSAERNLLEEKEHVEVSENKYRTLAENSPAIIYRILLKPSFKFEYVSPVVTEVTGYTPEDHYADPDLGFKMVHPDDRMILEKTTTQKTQGEPIVLRWIKKDGKIIWTEQRNVMILDSAGDPVAIEGIAVDITLQKEAEIALHMNKDLLNASQRLSKTGGWEWNVETQTMYWTEETFRIHDLTPSSVKPEGSEYIRLSSECYRPEDRPVILAAFQRCQEEGQPYDLEFPFTSVKGRQLWIRTIAEPVIENGKSIRIIGNIIDITGRKKAEEALRKSEDRLHTAREAILDSFLIFSAERDEQGNISDFIFTDINANAEKMLQLTSRQLIGKRMCEELPINRTNGFFEKYRNVVETGIPLEEEFYLPDTHVPAAWYYHQVVKCGDGIAISHRDISERKLAEEKIIKTGQHYQALIEKAPDGIVLIDARGNFKYISPAAKKMFGYAQTDEISGNPAEYTHPDDLQMVLSELGKIFEDPSYVPTLEYRFLDKRGQWHWIETTFSNLLANPNVESIVLNFHDITEHKLSVAMFKDIIEKNPMSIQILDMEGYPIQVNPAHTKLFGVEPPSGYSIFKDNQLLSLGFGELFDRIKKGEVVFFPDSYYNVHDVDPAFPDSPAWVKALGFTLNDNNGKPNKIVLMHENITERKNAEALLNDIIDNNPLSIQVVDKEGYTIRGNPAFIELFGSVPPPEFSIFDDLKSKSTELGNLVSRVKNGEIVHLPDIYFNAHDAFEELPDVPLWIRALIFPLNDSAGKPERFVFMHENITERKFAEQELIKAKQHAEESERKFREMAELLPQIVFETDSEGNLTYVNKSAYKLTGYSEQDSIIGKSTLDFYIPEDRERALRNIKNRFKGGKSAESNEYTMIRKDGSTLNILVYSNPIINNNIPVGLRGIIVDISEIKQAEEALRYSEEKFATAFQTSPYAITITHAKDGRFIEVNEAFTTMSGFTRDEALADSSVGLKLWLNSEDRNGVVNKILESGSITNHEYQFHRKDGTTFTGSFSARIIQLGGEHCILSSITDITDRRQMENKNQLLTSIIEKSQDFIGLATSDQQAFYINQAGQKMVGLENDEKVRATKIEEYLFPEDISFLVNTIYPQLMRDGRWAGEFRFKHFKTGEPIEVYYDLFLTEDPVSNNIMNISTITRDITLQKEMERQLITAKEHAEESDRLKSAFLANMSHEIRTPMNGILGFSELLKNPSLTGEQQQEYIGIIEKSGIRMLDIINDIVDISKIEAGLMNVNIRETEINEKIEFIYMFFKPQVEEKGMQLHYKNTLPRKEAIIKTDNEKVNSILTNLVKNAIKFSEKGSIEFGYEQKENDLEFYVKDTGIGIPKERQEAIFERFIQADISDKMARQGAGLGLSISKAYVEMLGGRIWVESVEGKGTTFYFTLPYNTGPDKKETSEKSVSAQNETNQIIPGVPQLKTVIAEDDETSELLISINIKEFSKEIIKVRTGNEVVEACRNNPDIDLILMDIQMPGMNGYEATRLIRQFNPNVIIIAQTAFGLTGDKEKAIDAGCNDHIAKPISKDELIVLIHKYFMK